MKKAFGGSGWSPGSRMGLSELVQDLSGWRHERRCFRLRQKQAQRPNGGTVLGELLEEQVVRCAGGEGPARSREGGYK